MVDLRHLQVVDGSWHYRWQVKWPIHAVVFSFLVVSRSQDNCLYVIDFPFFFLA